MRVYPWVGKIPWRGAWQPTPVFLPGESHGQRRLVGYGSWGHKEVDMTGGTHHSLAQYTLSQAWGHSVFLAYLFVDDTFLTSAYNANCKVSFTSSRRSQGSKFFPRAGHSSTLRCLRSCLLQHLSLLRSGSTWKNDRKTQEFFQFFLEWKGHGEKET